MQVLKIPTILGPNIRPAPKDEQADLERARYLQQRYKVPSEQIMDTMDKMDMRDRVMMELEMRERQQNLWQSDYNPFDRW